MEWVNYMMKFLKNDFLKKQFFLLICLLLLSACNNPVRFTFVGHGQVDKDLETIEKVSPDFLLASRKLSNGQTRRTVSHPSGVSVNLLKTVSDSNFLTSQNKLEESIESKNKILIDDSPNKHRAKNTFDGDKNSISDDDSFQVSPPIFLLDDRNMTDRNNRISLYPSIIINNIEYPVYHASRNKKTDSHASTRVLNLQPKMPIPLPKPKVPKRNFSETKDFLVRLPQKKSWEGLSFLRDTFLDLPKEKISKSKNNKTTKRKLKKTPLKLPKLDIVFIVDTNENMKPFLLSVKNKFDGFVDILSYLDWKIFFVSANSRYLRKIPLERNGKLLSHPLYLTKRLKHYKSIFIDTLGFHEASTLERELYSKNKINLVEVAEKINCELSPGCSYYYSTPLEKLQLLLENNDQSFFRPSADLAVIIISDDDENSWTDAKDVMDSLRSFKNAYKSEKKIKVYGIIMDPENELCIPEYDYVYSTEVYGYSEELSRLATLTGGKNFSLCDKNYTPLAQKIVADF